MAELLVRLRASTAALKGGRGRGDPVCALEDGHVYGSKEKPPDYAVLAFPGVTIAKLRKFLEPQPDPLTVGLTEIDPRSGSFIPVPPRLVRKALRRLDLSLLTQALRDKLETTGRLTIGAGGDIKRTQFLRAIKRRDDSRTAEDEGITLKGAE